MSRVPLLHRESPGAFARSAQTREQKRSTREPRFLRVNVEPQDPQITVHSSIARIVPY